MAAIIICPHLLGENFVDAGSHLSMRKDVTLLLKVRTLNCGSHHLNEAHLQDPLHNKLMNHRMFQWVLLNEVHEIRKQIEAFVRETNKKVKQTRGLRKIQP